MPQRRRLRDLIRGVRGCKTQQEERDLVAKESAELRSAFKEEQGGVFRFSAVVKLMFLHMLGYATHFGQMECVKLASASTYAEKRVGYLGVMVLLDENQEVLMMVTNSMKNDLRSKNQYISGLALSALGNISSDEMSRDLAPEVQKLMREPNAYIRKKAAACSIRIVRRVPELTDGFLEDAPLLLRDKHHGVLVSAVALAYELCLHSNNALSTYKKQVHQLVRQLNYLSNSSSSVEHDVSGVVDPFLQVRIVQLLRVLGKNDPDISDAMTDTLTHVASDRDLNRNAALSVAYECVKTITDIESLGSQRVLAINLLGRFLGHRDNNVRYVALETLVNVVSIDSQAVQRHRNTIIACMKDVDPSIRHRALDLLGFLANEESVRSLVDELLDHLGTVEETDAEFAAELAKRASKLVTSYSPDAQWQMDTILKLIEIAGQHLRNLEVADAIRLVSNTTWLHGYAARACYNALKGECDRLLEQGSNGALANSALIKVASWTIGEFGDMIITGEAQLDATISDFFTQRSTDEGDVVGVLESLSSLRDLDEAARQYLLIALMKLAIRFPSQGEHVCECIEQACTSSALDLQQRAIEFKRLYRLHSGLRENVLDRMPAVGISTAEYVEPAETQHHSTTVDDLLGLDTSDSGTAGSASGEANGRTGGKDAAALLGDLMLDDASATSNGGPIEKQQQQPASSDGNALGDLLGNEVPEQQAQRQQSQANSNPKDLLQQMEQQQTAPSLMQAPALQPQNIALQDQNGFTMSFATSEASDNGQRLFDIVATYTNASSASHLAGLAIQWAAPKDATLQLRQATGAYLYVQNTNAITQSMRVWLPQGKPLSMLARVSYTLASTGTPVQYQSKLQIAH